jgi:hypothetical protein
MLQSVPHLMKTKYLCDISGLVASCSQMNDFLPHQKRDKLYRLRNNFEACLVPVNISAILY